MKFCPECSNLLSLNTSIHTDIETKEDITSIISSILTEDYRSYVSSTITDSNEYSELSQKDKDKIDDYIESVNQTSIVMACDNCYYNEPIESGELVYELLGTTNKDTYDINHYEYDYYSKTKYITRKYICPNVDCPSHSDSMKREAFITRNSSNHLAYLCLACNSIF